MSLSLNSPVLQARFGAQPQTQPAKPGKLVRMPMFAKTVGPYQKSVSVTASNDKLNVLASQPAEGEMSLKLVPKTNAGLDDLLASLSGGLEELKVLFKREVVGETPEEIQYVDAAKIKAGSEEASLDDQRNDVGLSNTQALLSVYDDALDKIALAGGIRTVNVELPSPMLHGVDKENLVRQMATKAALKGFNYNFLRSNNAVDTLLEKVNLTNLVGLSTRKMEAAANEGQVLGQAMNLTRHLVEAPANVANTGYIAKKAEGLASDTMAVNVMDEAYLEGFGGDKRFGLLLGVGAGNTYDNATDRNNRQPRMVEMVHTPKDWDPATGKTVVLVGKGIIFDTGGSHLKPSQYIKHMHGDMAGAAAVLGTMKALDDSPVGVRVVGLMPLTENRLSGQSTLPHDIHQARSGKTVQINNTDAEGRLAMADAMNYGLEKYGADVDAAFTIATLTGGKAQAIGGVNAVGIAGNNQAMRDSLNRILKYNIGRTTGGGVLNDKHYKMVTQDGHGLADVSNASSRADLVHAGLVLEKDLKDANAETQKQLGLGSFYDGAVFVQAAGMETVNPNGTVTRYNVPWGHFDIAGAEFGKADPRRGGRDDIATGIGVEDLYLSLKGIASGDVDIDASKTSLPKKPANAR